MAIPYYFSEITLTQTSLATARSAYLNWVLGLQSGPTFRRRRLDIGILENWSEEEIVKMADLTGKHDCVVQSRSEDDLFLLRFRHREKENPVRLWTTAIEIRIAPNGITVRHGATVSGIEDPRMLPPPSPPRVMKSLIKMAGKNVFPVEIYRPTTEFTKDDASAFIDFVLLNRERRFPILVVTPDLFGKDLVEADRLAASTTGMVILYKAKNDEATWALTNELSLRGFDSRFSAWGGSVRLYDTPLLRQGADPRSHPLWKADRLRRLGTNPASVSDSLAIQLAERQVTRSTPPEHFELIEAHDRHLRQAAIAARREASIARMAQLENHRENIETIQSQQKVLDGAAADIKRLQESLEVNAKRQALELSESLEKNKILEELLVATEQDVKSLQGESIRARENFSAKIALMEQRTEQLEQELSEANAKGDSLEAALASRANSTTAVNIFSDTHIHALRARLGSSYLLEDALISAGIAFNSRLIILDSALTSAKKSHDFSWPDQAAELLWLLGGKYSEAVANGRPDGETKAIFGNHFAATESSKLSKNGRLLRTFVHEGTPIEMLRHLKIGIGEGTANCLRIHFHWDERKGKIIIGHCGRHLDF